MNNIYDVLIVGGGIAGLYLNYKLLKIKYKKTLLVEKYGVICIFKLNNSFSKIKILYGSWSWTF